MTRNEFLKTAAGLSTALLARNGGIAQGTSEDLERQLFGASGAAVQNADFELTLVPHPALKAKLIHKPSGLSLADGDYSYSFGAPSFDRISARRGGDATIITLEGTAAGVLNVKHEFRIPSNQPWIEESVALTNLGDYPVALPSGRCGFVLPLKVEGRSVEGPLKQFLFTAVPYRREPRGDRKQYADYTLAQVLTESRSSQLRGSLRIDQDQNVVTSVLHSTGAITTEYSSYASEGWVLTDGRRGFLISKYSQRGMEWALLDRVSLAREQAGLRWGGFGIFEGDPEHAAWIPPQGSHQFGVTRITAYAGGMTEGFYVFRAEMERRGQGCPKGFNPPAHWNELYDNKLWWLPNNGQDNPENRQKYYRLPDLQAEAAKAKEYHCEALYLDPGWDTNFASKIWDESRLGKLSDFAAMLYRDYGLRLSLHTPMSGWCNPSSYSRQIDRMKKDGVRVERSLCGASRQYVDESFRRLDSLAAGGASFFMFDGTIYAGQCWDANHGHPLPARREEHVQAMNRLARMVHSKHPRVLIEMHDQMLGGTTLRHVPTYYGYGALPPGDNGPDTLGFDTVWAFELMWDPMTDLVGGHAVALYYYNLAYSIPLYIHIDLRTDNEQALMLWWNASTCRHLGIGGTHREPQTQKAHQEAMATYRRLKPFFSAGTFYGIDELTHVHRHPTDQAAVINCFNLEEKSASREVRFEPVNFGLDAKLPYKVVGGNSKGAAGDYRIEVAIAGYGHTLIEVNANR